jgi:hypothetical protein
VSAGICLAIGYMKNLIAWLYWKSVVWNIMPYNVDICVLSGSDEMQCSQWHLWMTLQLSLVFPGHRLKSIWYVSCREYHRNNVYYECSIKTTWYIAFRLGQMYTTIPMNIQHGGMDRLRMFLSSNVWREKHWSRWRRRHPRMLILKYSNGYFIF